MKRIIATLLAAVLVFSLAACAKEASVSNEQTPAAAAVQETTAKSTEAAATTAAQASETAAAEETVLHLHMSTGVKKTEYVQALADEYYKKTGVKVEIDASVGGSDYHTKNVLMMGDVNNCPDVVLEDGFRVKVDSAAGLLKPLDNYLNNWSDFNKFSEALMAAGKGADGIFYALPLCTDVQIIWYNSKVMEAAGLGKDWQPQTWDDILTAANALKAANAGNPDFIPMFYWVSTAKVENTSMRSFQTLYAGTGEKLYNYDSGKWVINYPALKDTLSFVDQTWNKDNLCNMDLAANGDADTLIATDLLPNGKVGMVFGGSYLTKTGLGSAEELWDPMLLDGTIKYAYIPNQKGGNYVTMCGGWTWAIPQNAKNPDAAWDFIAYLNEAENLAGYCVNSALPIRDDVWTTKTWTSQKYVDMNAGFKKALEFAKFRDANEGYDSATQFYAGMVENVAFGLTTVDEAIATFENDMAAAVGADKIEVIK